MCELLNSLTYSQKNAVRGRKKNLSLCFPFPLLLRIGHLRPHTDCRNPGVQRNPRRPKRILSRPADCPLQQLWFTSQGYRRLRNLLSPSKSLLLPAAKATGTAVMMFSTQKRRHWQKYILCGQNTGTSQLRLEPVRDPKGLRATQSTCRMLKPGAAIRTNKSLSEAN